MAQYDIESRSVDWYSVHLFVIPVLDEAGSWPLAGSPAWRQLPDGHPAKLAAVLDGGRHWALHVDVAQEALAQASRAISAAADWAEISRDIRRRNAIYIPRRSA
ncbi:hypothetical protein AWC11_16985 [Mycobacterium interjectum]|uniref:PhiRv1 phage protein n=1 Tax=Mycobacterium terramassiliense TaxID=1841859 RepID=A0A2U3NEM0_9MYCO|nr:DUF2742 domain-containing protein [Mycobacterium terramassiliense]ORV86850.1 hypothetical protein AWC11_16985 [Mycobacterium interjectum]SPM29942.1 phiRv1 phage protein [Mycobacterium terramassiliense]